METVPAGYRQGIVTAITVFLGFSLAFLRFWTLEHPGQWTIAGVLSTLVVGAGIAFQLAALFRALDVRDESIVRYRRTVTLFRAGVVVIIVGVVMSMFVPA